MNKVQTNFFIESTRWPHKRERSAFIIYIIYWTVRVIICISIKGHAHDTNRYVFVDTPFNTLCPSFNACATQFRPIRLIKLLHNIKLWPQSTDRMGSNWPQQQPLRKFQIYETDEHLRANGEMDRNCTNRPKRFLAFLQCVCCGIWFGSIRRSCNPLVAADEAIKVHMSGIARNLYDWSGVGDRTDSDSQIRWCDWDHIMRARKTHWRKINCTALAQTTKLIWKITSKCIIIL